MAAGRLAAVPLVAMLSLACQFVVAAPIPQVVQDAPQNSWVMLGTNLFSDAWAPDGLTPFNTKAVIEAWSSAAWDSTRGNLILWGGGHANYRGNEVYLWSSATGQWSRGSLSSDIVADASVLARFETVDGPMFSPISMHTYDGNIYLPRWDRFLTFGGPAYNSGGPSIYDGGTLRGTGPYLWDPAKADPWKVGGAAGSHIVSPTYPLESIDGGNMWQNRDSVPNGIPVGSDRPFGGNFTAYADEGGKDVIYIGGPNGLWRYTIHSLIDPTQDQYELVGINNATLNAHGAGTYNQNRQLWVELRGSDLAYYDLSSGQAPVGLQIFNSRIVYASTADQGTFNFGSTAWPTLGDRYGIEYDPVRDRFLLWEGVNEIWELKAPADLANGNWIIARLTPSSTAGVVPDRIADRVKVDNAYGDYAFRGSGGKWKYLPDWDAFVGFYHPVDGEIWVYKPTSSCVSSISPATAALPSAAATGSVSINAPENCTWLAVSDATWLIAVGSGSGIGQGAIDFAVSPNTGAARTGTVSIGGKQLVVTQASGCTYSASPASLSVAATSEIGNIAVAAGSGCAWSAASNAPWLTVTSGASGVGDGTVGYMVGANIGAGRDASLVIGNQTVPVTQAAPLAIYQVSGVVTLGGSGLGGVVLTASGGVSCGTTSGTGTYSCTVPEGWTGTVTPVLAGYTFTPGSRSYSNVVANAPAQDYAAVAAPDTVWVEDAVPAGATAVGDNDGWTWVSSNPTPRSGTLAHQSAVVAGIHQHYFTNATTTLAVGVGDKLFAYVYLDPANPPSEVMLQWTDGSWEHRAYWGANLIPWGTDGTAGRRYVGPLPALGQWVRLEVPAAQVGLEGRTVNGMAYTLYGGRATWDRVGKSVAPPVATYQVSGLVTLSGAGLSGVALTASGGVSCGTTGGAGAYSCTVPEGWTGTVTPVLAGHTFTPVSRSYSGVTADAPAQDYAAVVVPTYQVSGVVTLGGSGLGGVVLAASGGVSCGTTGGAGAYSCTVPSGWSGTVTPALAGYTFTPGSRSYSGVTADAPAQGYVAALETVWVEDAVPLGSTVVGDTDGWTWVSSNPTPYSGSVAHQSAVLAGIHQHYFHKATTTLAVGVGDTLFAYVYLDPANPPSEVMLQWTDGSWEHRAYWGANLIPWGTDGTAGRRYVGPLPALGQWVRLEVPAAQVGLEERVVTGMAYVLYGGRATWDYAGKRVAVPVPTYQVSGVVTLGGSGLGGVVLAASGGVSCGTTSGTGTYSCTVPEGWTGTVTPALAGYTFTPGSRSYSNVTVDTPAQDYAAASLPTYQVSGVVTLGGSGLGGVVLTASGGVSCGTTSGTGTYSCTVPEGWTGTVTPVLAGYTFTPGSRSYSNVVANAPAQDYAAVAAPDTVWVEDAVPAGATAVGDNDGWTWVSSNPTPRSGTLAHQSAVVAGIHQHYFTNATTTLAVGVGDKLFAYVYLDPANPPSEVMLQWTDGSWEHRAYWGANLIPWGTDGTAGRRYVGPLPALGQWVRLEVPAAQVGLEERVVTGMAYVLYGGRATWDYAGK